MIKFLIVEQDLRVSGTSQGIISRSFLAKLRMAYPNAIIDVVYIKIRPSDDQLHLLPVDSIETHVLNLRIPFLIKFINRFYWRLFHVSLNKNYIYKCYAKVIAAIDYISYDHIFIRSSGIECETILGCHNLPILKKAFITFNEPYPSFWCAGNNEILTKIHLFKLKTMLSVVEQSKGCIATKFLGQDMQFLYGTRKVFYDLPHHFDDTVFNSTELSNYFPKNKKVTISYHGAIQFGRDLDEFLDVYCELINENDYVKENSEFFTRLKSSEYGRLKSKYKHIENIHILEGVDFSTSYYEQNTVSDINISLENGPLYCSVLLGKAPLLDFIHKRILSVSPLRSEMREIIKYDKYIATYKHKDEIKNKLNILIKEVLNDETFDEKIFGDYFSNENFIKTLNTILSD